MDPLSDVLKSVRLTGAHFFQTNASGPWGIEVAEALRMEPRVLPRSEGLMPYHIVESGRCWGGLVGEPLEELTAGAMILFPHGDSHVMAGHPRPAEVGPLLHDTTAPRFPDDVVFGPPGEPEVRLVCGFLGCDRRPFNPLIASLPRKVVVREGSAWVTAFARQVVEDTRAGAAGAESVLTRMAELMFIDVVRRHIDSLAEDKLGWLAGLRDPVIGKALVALHADPSRNWTLADLATAIASSRSVLAERFTRVVGVPPMQYLMEWRMQLAATRLRETNAKLATIALESGYESEAAFSRAFKRAVGVAPAAFRKAQQA